MCGIVGIWGQLAEDRDVLAAMMETVRHRGPDGQGIASLAGPFRLGHRRLAIVDRAGGAQPLWSHDRRFVITFNGEIFNYRALRNELEAAGAQFATVSDTEVVLEAFRRWGTAAFGRFNGQFAVGIVDTAQKTLTLARDPGGEKPLYLRLESNGGMFASELKALVVGSRRLGLPVSINPQGLNRFLALNYVPEPATLLSEIVALGAGEWLEVDGAGSLSRGSFPLATELPGASSWEDLLRDSVAIRLHGEVPVGLFLSGGLDSTAVATCIPEERRHGMPAFIADFMTPGFSEAERATATAHALGMVPHRVAVPMFPPAAATIRHLVSHADAPLGDSSMVPLALLSAAAREEVTVVLSGDGGDELLGGYLAPRATSIAAKLPPPLRRLLFALSPLLMHGGRATKVSLGEKAERWCRAMNLPPGAAHFAWNGMWQQAEKLTLLSPEMQSAVGTAEAFAAIALEFGVNLAAPTAGELAAADTRGYLCSDILAKVDRMTMAVGLEARPVFLDRRLHDFVAAHPDYRKPRFGQAKWPLAQVIAPALPQFPTRQQKLGFSVPIHAWFRDPNLVASFRSLLATDSNPIAAVLARSVVTEKLRAHEECKRDLGFELWGLLVLLLWGELVAEEWR